MYNPPHPFSRFKNYILGVQSVERETGRKLFDRFNCDGDSSNGHHRRQTPRHSTETRRRGDPLHFRRARQSRLIHLKGSYIWSI